jgi:hypothetical protein
MHLYLNYARAHWTHADENPPVGLILCAEHRAGVARYALEGLSSKISSARLKLVRGGRKRRARAHRTHPLPQTN